MELHILELKKLPPKDQNEDGIIRWMRFLGGKRQEEFEDMAKNAGVPVWNGLTNE